MQYFPGNRNPAGDHGSLPRKGLILVALIFLANPNWNLFDVLPDVVAYLLLIRALWRLSWFDESFGEGVRLLKRMAWLSGAQLILMLWSYTLSQFERPTMILTLTFVLAIARCVTVIPAMVQIFHGLSYQGMRNGGTEMFRCKNTLRLKYLNGRLHRQKERLRTITEDDRYERMQKKICTLQDRINKVSCRSSQKDITARMLARSCVFVVAKEILTVLPELSALSYRVSGSINWYAYIGMFRGVATVIAAIWGLSWLISSFSYVRAVAGDTAFWQAMESEYREYCHQNPSKKPRRDAANAFAFLWVGSFFALDFTMDFVDMIPECLLSILFLFGFCFLRPYLSEKIFRVSAFLCSLHSILSLVLQVLLTLRLWNVDITKIDRSEAVYSAWAQALGLTICRAILFVLPMVSLALVMMYLIRSGVGHFGKGERTLTDQRTILSLKRGVYLVLASGAISAISHVAYLALRPKFDFVWIPEVLFSLLFILELYRVTSMLKENLVYERLVEPEAEQGTIA